MITVHHLETSRSQRVLWLLEELRIEYEIVRYPRDPKTRLADPALRRVHPLGKSPVITDGDVSVAESGAILEYIAATHAAHAPLELMLQPPVGGEHWLQERYWMHFAEGSLMNWLVMKLVFMTIPTQPMPFFVRPIARQLCAQVQKRLIDPNVGSAVQFMEQHLARNEWFGGERLGLADFQMSFAVEAALARSAEATSLPRIVAYRERMQARPAYQRALAKGGPVLMTRAA